MLLQIGLMPAQFSSMVASFQALSTTRTEAKKSVFSITKNRERVQARAVLISEEMERRTFDYLSWFPHGNNADRFRVNDQPTTINKTVGEFFTEWIEARKPP